MMPAGAASTMHAKSRLAAFDLSAELGGTERGRSHLREQREHLAIFCLELAVGAANRQYSSRETTPFDHRGDKPFAVDPRSARPCAHARELRR